MSGAQSVYACSTNARALAAQRGSAKHRFLVGTCSLHDANELCVLEFDEEQGQLNAVSLYAHPDQVWALETSTQDPSLVVTSRQSQQQSSLSGVTLWRMPATANAVEKADLVEVAAVTRPVEKESYAHSIRWHPGSRDALLVCEDYDVSVYSIDESTVTCAGKLTLPRVQQQQQQQQPGESELSWVGTGTATWDPMAGSSSAAAAHGPHVILFDTRSMAAGPTAQILNAHGGGAVRDLDYNPNKAHVLLTCGHDRSCKVWDLRSTKAPIKVLSGHSHWVSCCRYNPCHDQLLLTGGCDQLVNLWRATSVSSAASGLSLADAAPTPRSRSRSNSDGGTAPFPPGSPSSPTGDAPDAKVRCMDQHHEDSVYAVAWGGADAWVHASLSFDGRVVLDHVPSAEKYKILL